MKNLYQYWSIPDAVTAGFVALCLLALVAPYIGEKDFGFVKIPAFSGTPRMVFQVLGPIFMVGAILGFIPFFSSNPQSETSNVAEANTVEWSKINDNTALVKEIGDVNSTCKCNK